MQVPTWDATSSVKIIGRFTLQRFRLLMWIEVASNENNALHRRLTEMPLHVHWMTTKWFALSLFSDKNPPPDSISEKITPRVISVGLFILMTVLAALGIVLSCLFLVFNIRYRHCKWARDYFNNLLCPSRRLRALTVRCFQQIFDWRRFTCNYVHSLLQTCRTGD